MSGSGTFQKFCEADPLSLGALPDALFTDVCERLNQIIRLA